MSDKVYGQGKCSKCGAKMTTASVVMVCASCAVNGVSDKTEQKMVEELVQGMIDGGGKPAKKHCPSVHRRVIRGIRKHVTIRTFRTKSITSTHWQRLTYPDLILNADAMIPLFGERETCTGFLCERECTGCRFYIPMYKHHALKAAELILDGKSGIKYLYEEWKKSSCTDGTQSD